MRVGLLQVLRMCDISECVPVEEHYPCYRTIKRKIQQVITVKPKGSREHNSKRWQLAGTNQSQWLSVIIRIIKQH
ncbi:hypothetical protein Lal_00022857 [Lupinus albus]|nr:hypothetical protein Lal_00022857 [Lupinus albus]